MSSSVANRFRRRVVAVVAVLLGTCATGAIVSAQDSDAWSIPEFVQKRSKWPALKGTSLKIEGRCPLIGEKRILFEKCDLVFEFDSGVRPPASSNTTTQVTGSLENRKGKLLFVITRIKDIPSDVERLGDQRVRLPQDDAAAWFALADWAIDRGSFYEDKELLAGAAELRRSAIQIEYRQTNITDIEPLYALAKKAERLGLPPDVRDEINHDAVRRELRAAQKRDVRQRETALTHAIENLPGAGITVDRGVEDVQQLQQEYERQPLESYRKADAGQRHVLNRFLYSAAQLERIKLDAADDGSNGFEIAMRIERTLPEFANLADEYREREMTGKLKNISTLSRDELLLLGERLEQTDLENGAARAAKARRSWLASQEPIFRERGSSGLLDLAKEHIALVDDAAAAARIYMDLYQSTTGRQTAATELVKLGYLYDGNDWVKSSEAAPDSTADAISLGIVRSGMTADQVRAALGKPTSVVKFAVRDLVSELWVYQEHGVAIELRRRGAEGASIAREISDLGGRPAL